LQFEKTKQLSVERESIKANNEMIRAIDKFTGGAATSFKKIVKGTKAAISSMGAFKAALAATGIGLLVVATGYIVENWDKINASLFGANEKTRDSISNTKELLKEEERKLEYLNNQDKVLLLQGATELEILRLKKEQTKEILKQLKAQLKAQDDAVSETVGKVSGIKGLLSSTGFGFLSDLIFGEPGDISKAGENASNELQQEIDKIENEIAGLELRIRDKVNKESTFGGGMDKMSSGNGLMSMTSELTDENKARLSQEELLLKKIREANEASMFEQGQINARISQENEDKLLAIKRANAVATEAIFRNSTGSLMLLSEKNLQQQKLISAAQATFNTYQAVSAALAQTTDPTPTQSLRFGNAISAGVFGLLQVRKILSTNTSSPGGSIGGGGASGGGVPNTGGDAARVPSFDFFNQGVGGTQNSRFNLRGFIIQQELKNERQLDERLNDLAKI